MKRPRAGSSGPNLLPLLDVLLCTMGTLIVVLGVVNREARLHPSKRMSGKAAEVAARNQQLKEAQEDWELQIEQLTGARDKTLADLENARTRLAGIEEHSREMQDQLLKLGASANQLRNTNDPEKQRDTLRNEIAALNSRRLQLEKDLQRARAEAGNQKPVYAVVPFEGMYQTNRRPIYIECRGDAVVLQPEGIVFTPTDFMGPGGPGNPLAAALRAAQEYWRYAPAPGGVPNEPYPLLLVRPDGVIAYYLARDAMSSWNAEFGYELIGADWKLDFPIKPEPKLKEMETRAVAEARDRLQWLAEASPETFGRKPKTQYRMTPMRGGVVRDGGPALGNDPFANDPLGGFGKSPGGRGPGDPGAFANGGTTTGSTGNSAFGSGTQQSSSAFGNGGTGSYGGAGANAGTGGFENNSRGNSAFGNGGGQAANESLSGNSPSPEGPGFPNGSNGPGGQLGTDGGTATGGPNIANVGPRYAGQSNGTHGGGQNNGAANGGSPNGSAGAAGGGQPQTSEYGGVAWPQQNGGPAGSNNSFDPNATAAGGQTASSGPSFNDIARMDRSGMPGGSSSTRSGSSGSSQMNGNSSNSSFSGGSQPSSGSSGQSGSPSDPMSSGTPSPSFMMNQQSGKSVVLNRGKNWALPTSSTASIPLTRPIRIECYADRLVLLPDSRDQQPQIIPLTDRTEASVDQLVSAVRGYTRTWGMAGRSMYWKPQLVLEVKPSAERRAADLQALLADSGLDVTRR